MQLRSTWLLALPLSAVGVVGMICVLALNLVREPLEPQAAKPRPWSMTLAQPDETAQTRQRQRPEPPEPVEVEVTPTQLQAAPQAVVQTEMPQLQLDIQMPNVTSTLESAIKLPGVTQPTTAVAAAGAGSALDLGSLDIQPTQKTPPRYPPEAKRRKIEGDITLGFTINQQGRAVDIEVIDGQHRRFFERDAIRTLRTWRFPVHKVNGEAVDVPNQVQVIQFRLD